MIGITLKNFQVSAVDFLYDSTIILSGKKKTITVESPTGSGKTIILIAYIEKYLDYIDDTVFVWLTPGKGELEEQSREKMIKFAPGLKTGTIFDVLKDGFQPKGTYFINWESITKKDNIAISDTEKANLFNRVADAHRKNLNFIIIIDEEHLNDTRKAKDIIDALSASAEIRVSATPLPRKLQNSYIISEIDVINEELITKALLINHGLDDISNQAFEKEAEVLIKKADEIRKSIKQEYSDHNENINPLVLIQFPNLNDDLIESVEKTLDRMGYNYSNKRVSSWFSEVDRKNNTQKSKKIGKINIGVDGEEDSVTNINATPNFLLFKQALSTGWDCPRAKILVKLREGMSEQFEIQTLGRLRRMPMAKHYGTDVLDCSYLYTFDEKYKQAAIEQGAFETERLYLKSDAKDITLTKEIRNKDASYVDERSFRDNFFSFIVDKYKLSSDKNKNKDIFESNGFIFGNKIRTTYLTGRVIQVRDFEKEEGLERKELKYEVNTHIHGIELRHVIDNLKKYSSLDYSKTRMLFEILFRKKVGLKKFKLIDLELKEFYAFIINNESKLKDDLIAFDAKMVIRKLSLEKDYKKDIFTIPTEDHYKFYPNAKDFSILDSNVYERYNASMLDGKLRSTAEVLFEKYCEANDSVEFVYKNGDSGQKYLSIVYSTGTGNVRNFYPDYVVKLNNGNVWIIETKGGEFQGESKDIDKQSHNKFEQFKRYAIENGYNFAFVRDINNTLYFNNTQYSDDMSTEQWKKLTNLF